MVIRSVKLLKHFVYSLEHFDCFLWYYPLVRLNLRLRLDFAYLEYLEYLVCLVYLVYLAYLVCSVYLVYLVYLVHLGHPAHLALLGQQEEDCLQ